jgi:hypothetical protein
MLEAAEGMVKVALDTHESREAAYTEQQDRNVKWATRISKMLEQMVPAKPEGVCHKTVDCEECHGLTDEAECRQKLGIWVPHVSVMKAANKEAAKDQARLNEEVGRVSLCWCGCSCVLCRCVVMWTFVGVTVACGARLGVTAQENGENDVESTLSATHSF